MKSLFLVLGFVLVSGQKLLPNRQVPYPAVLLASNANLQQREAVSHASQNFNANSRQTQSISLTTTNVQENHESQSSQSEDSDHALFSLNSNVEAQQIESASFTNQDIATQFERENEQSQSATNIEQQTSQEIQFTPKQRSQQVLSPEEEKLLLRQAEGPYPIDGVFEPLNLPAGAYLLMRQIDTTFECGDKPYGFYADESNDCRVFHVCNRYDYGDGRTEYAQFSFMCSEFTVFDQKKLTCVNRYEASPCQESSYSYSINEEFGLPEEKA